MDFFKSMLSDDPQPENMDNDGKSETDRRTNQSPQHQGTERAEEEYTNLNPTSTGDVGGRGLWSFGDLVKTLTTRSESVLETYRRDLKEFGSGLRKESDLFREVASRAVKELPSSIEVGASAIDGVLKSTADIISQGKDGLLEPSGVYDSDASESVQNYGDRSSSNSRGYSRFDSQLNAIQVDARTYCEDPEDLDDYNKWKLGFVLGDRESEIEKLIGENESVEAIYIKVVPNEVDDGSLWCRYFYRVHKLKQQEDMRANLVRRSLTVDDEEELSWDVDDEEEEVDQVKPNTSNSNDLPEIEEKQSSNHETKTVSRNVADDDTEKNIDAAIVNKNNADEPQPSVDLCDQEVESVQKSDGDPKCSENAGKDSPDQDLEKKIDVKSVLKTCEDLDRHESGGEDGDIVAVSAQVSLKEEEDLEWDEIGEIGDDEEKDVLEGDSLKKDELFKRVNTAEDDEDLSWDIEDDDEPVKAGSSN